MIPQAVLVRAPNLQGVPPRIAQSEHSAQDDVLAETNEPAESAVGPKLATLFMIVTERDHLIADYAIRSFGKIYDSNHPRAKSFTLYTYLNCLSDATLSRFLPRWSALPWVNVFDNTAKAARLNLRKGETIISPERFPRVRNLANENQDELWSSELLRFKTKFVGTVDADFEVLAPDFFFAALDELERDETLAGCSTNYSDTTILVDTFSNRTIRLNERWHTHFCLYRRSALARSRISHFYYEIQPPRGIPVVYDSAAYLQSHLIEEHGFRFVSLPGEYQQSFIHYAAFSKLKRTDPRRIRRIRRVSLLSSKGLIYGANRYGLVWRVNRAVRALSRVLWGRRLRRWAQEKSTFDFGVWRPPTRDDPVPLDFSSEG